MISLDTSVLVESLIPDAAAYKTCSQLVQQTDVCIYSHALSETFATLTGGALGFRVDAATAADLIKESIVSKCVVIHLDTDELLAAQRSARSRGVRGGAIYDYLHLAAARKAQCESLYTLNISDFAAIYRDEDPGIKRP